MDNNKNIVGLVGLFDDADTLVQAAQQVRQAGFRKWDCHTPYPVHQLDKAMGIKPSPIPRICLFIGFVGAGVALLMQWWMNAVDFPIIIGGKPLFSWPAFVPITFELFVLFAALSTVVCLIVFCRLWRWHSPLHDSDIARHITSDRFALVLESSDPLFTSDQARKILEQSGCRDIRDLWEQQ